MPVSDLVRKIFDGTKADCDQDHLPVMLYSFPGDIPVRRNSCWV